MKKQVKSAKLLPPPKSSATEELLSQVDECSPSGTSFCKIMFTGAVFFLFCFVWFIWLAHSNAGSTGGGGTAIRPIKPSLPPVLPTGAPDENLVYETFGVIRSAVTKQPSVARMDSASNFYRVYFMEEESSRLSKETLKEMRRSFGVTSQDRNKLRRGYGNCCYWFWVDNREDPKQLCIIAEPLNGNKAEWRYYLGSCKLSTTEMLPRDYAKLSESEAAEVYHLLQQPSIGMAHIFTLLKPTMGRIGPQKVTISSDLEAQLKKALNVIAIESRGKAWRVPSSAWIVTQWERLGGEPSDRVKFVHDGNWKLVVEREGTVFDATFQYEYEGTKVKVLPPSVSKTARMRKFEDIKDDGWGGSTLVPPPPASEPITVEEFKQVFGLLQTKIREAFPDEVPSSAELKASLSKACGENKGLGSKIQAYEWMILADKVGNSQNLLCWKEGEEIPAFYANVADSAEGVSPLSGNTWKKNCKKKFALDVGKQPDKLGTDLPTDLKWEPIQDNEEDGQGEKIIKGDSTGGVGGDPQTGVTDGSTEGGQSIPGEGEKEGKKNITVGVKGGDGSSPERTDPGKGEKELEISPIDKDEFKQVFGLLQTKIRKEFPNEVPASAELKASLSKACGENKGLGSKIQAYEWMILEDKRGNSQKLLCWKNGEEAPAFYANVADSAEGVSSSSGRTWKKNCKKEFGLGVGERPDKLGTNSPTNLKWEPIPADN